MNDALATGAADVHVDFPGEELADLRRRIAATRWPEKETVTDQSQGLDIHFVHVRSDHDGALPIVVNHGWPGSIVEQLKIIDRLTDPTAHGASEADAFHVVVPSMPCSPASSTRHHAAGRSRPLPTCSTTTRSTRAATSPPGSNRRSSPRSSAPPSAHCSLR
jgi:hypothetical protein